ncbi:mogroside I-E synthase-like [Apium graveolens]|uniref:mogroside I-E synthase-like n=1 Tax=Apium graveolens TaxID=4045 RepID=UPI003D7B93E7
MASNPHVLVIANPLQGHLNPVLQFAKRLAFKGLMVTLVATSTISKSLITENGLVKIVSISDGSEDLPKQPLDNDTKEPLDGSQVESNQPSKEVHGSAEDKEKERWARFQPAVSQGLIELIERHKDSCNPFRVLIYDSMMPWCLDIAHQQSLKGASFFTQSCIVSLLYFQTYAGTLQLPTNGSVVSVPQLSVPLQLHDLPSFIYDTGSNPAILKYISDQFSNFKEADWLLFNTFDKLENEVVNWMAEQWSIKTIGPAIPSMYTDKRVTGDKDYDLNLFTADQDTCKNWLDTKTKGSVVYVSFGSIANLKEEQMTELAFGLSNSNIAFLWIIRASEEAKLPVNFMSEALKNRCLIVNWCSQLQVLSHEAVGCFMSHCGWNSTLEALSLGVPVVAMPQWTDQTTNAKFIVDVWKMGVRVKVNEKEIATREHIEACLKEVMEGEKRNELKINALKFKEFAKAAMDEGGSSDNNISKFISSI